MALIFELSIRPTWFYRKDMNHSEEGMLHRRPSDSFGFLRWCQGRGLLFYYLVKWAGLQVNMRTKLACTRPFVSSWELPRFILLSGRIYFDSTVWPEREESLRPGLERGILHLVWASKGRFPFPSFFDRGQNQIFALLLPIDTTLNTKQDIVSMAANILRGFFPFLTLFTLISSPTPPCTGSYKTGLSKR